MMKPFIVKNFISEPTVKVGDILVSPKLHLYQVLDRSKQSLKIKRTYFSQDSNVATDKVTDKVTDKAGLVCYILTNP